MKVAVALVALLTVACGGSSTGPGPTPATMDCSVGRPDFGGPATQADRAVFAYDANAPLNLQQTVQSTDSEVQVSSIAYTSPGGGSVPGILVEPVGRPGPRPALILVQVFQANALTPLAKIFAQSGAVVIAIDPPSWRYRGAGPVQLFTSQDRTEQIQMIKDLRRAIDILQAHPNVDDNRIGLAGNSYGGMMGALLVGVDSRLKAAVLSTAPGGWVTFHTSTFNLSTFMAQVNCAARTAWFNEMVPIEPIRYVNNSTSTALLFQIAQLDTAVAQEDAMALYNAAGGPKELRFYNAGHNLNAESQGERFAWLRDKLGFDPDPPPPGGGLP